MRPATSHAMDPADQPAGVLATWLEACLRDELRPWFVRTHRLIQLPADPASGPSARLLQQLQRLRARLEALEMPAQLDTGLLGRMRDFMGRERHGKLLDGLEAVLAAVGPLRVAVQAAHAAHDAHEGSLRGFMVHFDLELETIDERLRWSEETLHAMRRKLIVRRPDAPGRSRQLLVHLSKCVRSVRNRLQPLQQAMSQVREVREQTRTCLQGRASVIATLRSELAACQAQLSTGVQTLEARLHGHPAGPGGSTHELVAGVQRLHEVLGQAIRSLVQVRLDEETLAEGLHQLNERLLIVLQAPDWQELPTTPTSLLIGLGQPCNGPADSLWTDAQRAGDEGPSARPKAREARHSGIAEAMALARRNNRACPTFAHWTGLHDVLLQSAVLGDAGAPPAPIARQDWEQVSAIDKRLRLKEQLHWAQGAGCLDQVVALLSTLDESQWEHMSG